MSEPKFTPKPWKVYTAKAGHKVIGIGDANGEGITDSGFGVWRGGSAEAEANAHLISAAPDLYEALRDLVRTGGDDHMPGYWEAAEAALAKAEGRSDG